MNIPNLGHATLLNGLPVSGFYNDDNGNTVETMTLNVLRAWSYSGDNRDDFVEKTYVFEKQKDVSWKQAAKENSLIFQGYGQINKELSKYE